MNPQLLITDGWLFLDIIAVWFLKFYPICPLLLKCLIISEEVLVGGDVAWSFRAWSPYFLGFDDQTGREKRSGFYDWSSDSSSKAHINI